jgi:hypothetical protein
MEAHKIWMLISAVCWSLVYIEIIRLGFKYKTYGMPLFALALNFAWEFLYGFIVPAADSTQHIVNIVWFSLDVLIVITFFLYGFQFFPKGLNKVQFFSWGILVFALGFLLQFLFHAQFESHAEGFSAFLQNVLMSILFIGLLIRRTTTEGQSLLIAIAKCLGTLAATLGIYVKISPKGTFELPNWEVFLVILGILCFVFDVLYIVLLTRKKRQKTVSPI